MEPTLLRFVAVLRARGVRISVAEVTDAARAAGAVGLRQREPLRLALKATLIKDDADEETFDEVFGRFFHLIALRGPATDPDHTHDDLSDDGEAVDLTLSAEPSPTPQTGHSHDEPVDIRDLFDEKDLAQQYNRHQEANKIDMAAMTDELSLSADQAGTRDGAGRVQLETSRLSGAAAAKDLTASANTRVDAELSVAGHRALERLLADAPDADRDALLARIEGMVGDLPEMLRKHLEKFLELDLDTEGGPDGEITPAFRERADERERRELDEVLDRLGRRMRGALTHRRRPTVHGRIDVSRTMARNMRYDGVPFRPVLTGHVPDRPRLVVLADASMSVRTAARFTWYTAHGLARRFRRVRTFAFVDDVVEISDVFGRHHADDALGLVFGGDLVDIDATSDYGRVFETFAADHLPALTRRTTLLVLGDGRGNGRDPGLDAFELMKRHCRRVVWLSPEPRYSWGLGACDLPRYAPLCDRMEVVRDVAGLDRVTRELGDALA